MYDKQQNQGEIVLRLLLFSDPMHVPYSPGFTSEGGRDQTISDCVLLRKV